MSFKEEFGKLVKEHRHKQFLTQAQLADLVGVSRITILNIENGIFNTNLMLGFQLAEQLQIIDAMWALIH